MARERELVVRAAAGDREAFDWLSELCRPWLYGLCLRVVQDRDVVDDLVQETLVRAFRDLPQLRDSGLFRAWLSRVALNVCRMHLRHSHPELEQELVSPEALSDPKMIGHSLLIGEALAQLGMEDRRLLVRFYLEGLNQAELADWLSLSASAVKSRLHRSRERLRKEMLGMMSEREKEQLGAENEGELRVRTVLLVEPEEVLRGALLAGLRGAGYEVVMLPTGEAALEAIDRREGQFLILDKHCGEPHWTEVLALVQLGKWSRKKIPVGVLVDPDNKRDVLLAWQCGAEFCLTRPPDVAEVVEMMKRVEAAQAENAEAQ